LIAGSALTITGFVLLGILFSQLGLSTYLSSQYIDSYAAESGKGYLAAGIFLVRVGSLVLLLGAMDFRKKLPIFPILLFLGIWAFYLRVGRRGVVLSGGLAALIILHFYYKPIKYKTLIAIACVGIVLFMAVAHARAYSAGGFDGMVVGLKEDFVFEDAWLNMQEINTVPMAIREMTEYVPNQAPYFYGRSYWEAFEILVPLELHPNRPLASSQWFAWYHDPLLAARGGGFAFSLIAEGYVNFGYAGAFLVGLIQGAFLKTLVQWRRNNPISKSRLLVYACVGMQVLFFIRGDFGALLKLAVVVGFSSLALAMLLGRAKKEGVGQTWSAA
jgi:oligosaccharide repeat unit polymerase